jgi:hypothetical protein
VKVNARPACDADTSVGATVIVPEPSAALRVIEGEEARVVSVPPVVDFSCACQVCAPVVAVAVAPAPPPDLSPYTIVNMPPVESVTPETVISCPEADTVPVDEVV